MTSWLPSAATPDHAGAGQEACAGSSPCTPGLVLAHSSARTCSAWRPAARRPRPAGSLGHDVLSGHRAVLASVIAARAGASRGSAGPGRRGTSAASDSAIGVLAGSARKVCSACRWLAGSRLPVSRPHSAITAAPLVAGGCAPYRAVRLSGAEGVRPPALGQAAVVGPQVDQAAGRAPGRGDVRIAVGRRPVQRDLPDGDRHPVQGLQRLGQVARLHAERPDGGDHVLGRPAHLGAAAGPELGRPDDGVAASG